MEERADLLSVAPEGRNKTNGLTVQSFRLDMRENFLPVSAIQHWNSLLCAVAGFPLLEVFQQRLD